jgi:hypothetical protein
VTGRSANLAARPKSLRNRTKMFHVKHFGTIANFRPRERRENPKLAHKYLQTCRTGSAIVGLLGGTRAGCGPNHAARSGAPQSCAQTAHRSPNWSQWRGKSRQCSGCAHRGGWNYISHCYANQWYYDGTDWWEYNYDDDGTFWYYVINSPLEASGANQLKNACEHGSYWIYVTNTSTSAYSHIWIYDHLN